MDYKSPFLDRSILEKRITFFLSKHRTTIFNNKNRISALFEMGCYNDITEYYESRGYSSTIENLNEGKFRYKLSAAGNPKNFSHFKISKLRNTRNGITTENSFEIHHNLAIQSCHSNGIFVVPDISVIDCNSVSEFLDSRYYFRGLRAYYYVKNENLQTFFECKHLNPFPELVFSFSGVYNEIEAGNRPNKLPKHIAPSLLISGQPNFHLIQIREALQSRYRLNIVYGLFSHSFKSHCRNTPIFTIGTK
jgi:hypothetical protein